MYVYIYNIYIYIYTQRDRERGREGGREVGVLADIVSGTLRLSLLLHSPDPLSALYLSGAKPRGGLTSLLWTWVREGLGV